MTKKDAIRLFRECYPKGSFMSCYRGSRPGVKNLDRPARDQAWNDFVDGLYIDKEITEYQCNNWTHPWND